MIQDLKIKEKSYNLGSMLFCCCYCHTAPSQVKKSTGGTLESLRIPDPEVDP